MWSKLQKQLYKIISPDIDFQIHCSVYKTKSAWTAGQKAGISKKREQVPRYWITVNNEIVWDFPNMFLDELSQDNTNTIRETYFFPTNYFWVHNVIQEYINTPRQDLLTVSFKEDKYNLVNTLRKYDKRISKYIRREL